MSLRSVNLDDFFTNTPIMKLGKKAMNYSDLSDDETGSVMRVFREGIRDFGFRTPKGASLIANQESDYVKWTGIAKAGMDEWPVANPGGPGKILVDWLIPENLKLDSGSTNARYTIQTINTWTFPSTTVTAWYLLGNATAANSYKPGATTAGSQTAWVLAKDGIFFTGATPSITNLRCISDADSQYTSWCMRPLTDQPIEEGKAIYNINTPGMIPCFNDMGIHLYGMPYVTANTTVQLAAIDWLQYGAFSVPVTRA